MSNIIKFPTDEVPPDDVLQCAVDKLKSVVLVGFDNDGELYIASSGSRLDELLFLNRCLTVHLDKYVAGDA